MPAVGRNRYELRELLGEGGMGVVYRAFDSRTNTYVALKTLRDASDAEMLEMFKREWAELAKVPHPNIVDIRDVDEIEENGVRKPCFIMPLLPGCTLAALIKASSPRLTTEFVVNVICQVCKGLQAAHENGIIHRDLKPSNIFIMDDDTAKIIDFGLVYTVGNKSTTGLKGTWQYMSPEQIEGTKQPNRSFDIFSLGVVAYEALTGHQPFKRAKFEDTLEAIRHFVPQPISERNPNVQELVSKAVHVAIAKQPIHRYATAREFAETLQKAFQNRHIERFDAAKIRPRIDRAKRAFQSGDSDFASEILTELEAEGNIDTDITLLRSQIDEFNKQKRVRQLFEAAQTRLEQDEIPLALEKLAEILKIDPKNTDALILRKGIEQARSERQVSEWLTLARKHLDRNDFNEARRALKEVFNLKYDEPEAARLKAEADSREKEVEAARAEKQSLYNEALRNNQNGEISTALSGLEKLLEVNRSIPGAAVPERDKVFQAFYNDVRTERDRIDGAYAEGVRHLGEKNFEKALQVCDDILQRYPKNPQFQALRLKVEHAQRQGLSSYIADVGRAVIDEPSLDRRVSLLEQACQRYPTEGQFPRQLSLARELRDLLNAIVSRARNYEEQDQFSEAIAQWNTLAQIHPQYPGIDFEIIQLERRREQQAEEDKRHRLVERIDRAFENSAYADAERLITDGLLEFPQNPELLTLLRLAHEGLAKIREANELIEEAKTRRSQGNWDQAMALLRRALELDHGNIVISNTLVNLLVERSHTLLQVDPVAAEPLAAEAARLDPEHPSVKTLTSLVAQEKRRKHVETAVLEARTLQNTDRDKAIFILKQSLDAYPGESRLLQTLSSLQKEDRGADSVTSASGVFGSVDSTQVLFRTPAAAAERVKPTVAPPPPRVVITSPKPRAGGRFVWQMLGVLTALVVLGSIIYFGRSSAFSAGLLKPQHRGFPIREAWPWLSGLAIFGLGFALASEPVRGRVRLSFQILSQVFRRLSGRDRAKDTRKDLKAPENLPKDAATPLKRNPRPLSENKGEQTVVWADASQFTSSRIQAEDISISTERGFGTPQPPRVFFPPNDELPRVYLAVIKSYKDSFRGDRLPISGFPFQIGRSNEFAAFLADPTMSRDHAQIDWKDNVFTITDLGSINGTQVHGIRLRPKEPVVLRFGAEIRLSRKTKVVFRCEYLEELPDLTGITIAGKYTLCRKMESQIDVDSVLYEAKEKDLPRRVCVKLLSPGLRKFPNYTQRFAAEAEMAADLHHPHICRLLSYGTTLLPGERGNQSEVNYICTEMMESGSLADRLAKEKYLPLPQVDLLLEKVIDALGYAHSRGKVHGDLTPDCIVFDDNNSVYLRGFAKGPDTGFAGTADFMAPEQWDRAALPETDQYSLAVITFLALSGTLPFHNQEEIEARDQNFEHGPPDVREIALRSGWDEIPQRVSDVLRRALSKEHAKRYSSIREYFLAFRYACVTPVATGSQPIRAFLSYHRKSSGGLALYVQRELKDTHNILAFIDTDHVDGAPQILAKVEQGIRQSDVFVCLLARDTLLAAWVQDEIRMAWELGKSLIPVIQQSFQLADDAKGTLPQPAQELLNTDFVEVLDEKNLYVDEAIAKLAKIIKSCANRSRSARA